MSQDDERLLDYDRLEQGLDYATATHNVIVGTSEPYVERLRWMFASWSGAEFASFLRDPESAFRECEAVIDNVLIPRFPGMRWTAASIRKSDGEWRSSIWLLPRGMSKIECIGAHLDRVRAQHACYVDLVKGMILIEFHRLEIETRREDERRARREDELSKAMFEERIRLQEEHVRVTTERRRKRAEHDAEWDSVAPTVG